MPWRDWQFWVVTAAAIVALAAVWRAVVPKRRPPPKRTELTIGGRKRGGRGTRRGTRH